MLAGDVSFDQYAYDPVCNQTFENCRKSFKPLPGKPLCSSCISPNEFGITINAIIYYFQAFENIDVYIPDKPDHF